MKGRHLRIFREALSKEGAIVYHRTGRRGAFLQAVEKGASTLVSTGTPFIETLNAVERSNIIFDESAQKLFYDLMTSIVSSGLKKNVGIYGPVAVYNTFKLESQVPSRMSGYGLLVIESYAKFGNTLIFEPDIAQEIYGEEFRTVEAQLKYFKAPMDSTVLAAVQYADQNPTTYSAEHAHTISNLGQFARWVQSGIVKSIVYNGSNDGFCFVIYDDSLIVPKRLKLWGPSYESEWSDFDDFEKFLSTHDKAGKVKSGLHAKKNIIAKSKLKFDVHDTGIEKTRAVAKALQAADGETLLQMIDTGFIDNYYVHFQMPVMFSMLGVSYKPLWEKIVEKKWPINMTVNINVKKFPLPQSKDFKSRISLLHACIVEGSNHTDTTVAFQEILKMPNVVVDAFDTNKMTPARWILQAYYEQEINKVVGMDFRTIKALAKILFKHSFFNKNLKTKVEFYGVSAGTLDPRKPVTYAELVENWLTLDPNSLELQALLKYVR